MTTWMAETCRWSLYYKITFIKQTLHLLVFLIKMYTNMIVVYTFQKPLELYPKLPPFYRMFCNSNNWICHLHVHAVKWEYIFVYRPTFEHIQCNFHPTYTFWQSHCKQQTVKQSYIKHIKTRYTYSSYIRLYHRGDKNCTAVYRVCECSGLVHKQDRQYTYKRNIEERFSNHCYNGKSI
jgi:hypothetical protein